MATIASPSSDLPSRPTYACIRCAGRKVKCDRQRPCSSCVKHNVECVFHPSQGLRKRRKRVKVQQLAEQLKHYETLLQEQGIDPSALPNTPDSEPRGGSRHPAIAHSNDAQIRTPSSIEQESNRIGTTSTVNGQEPFKFVENSLWTRVLAESHDPEDTLEDLDNPSDLEVSDDELSFVLRNQANSKTRPRHPPPERIHMLWKLFTENVDPLTKIVHVPTLRLAIQRAATDTSIVPRCLEVLMFAIYAAAVMSLKDEECRTLFTESRKTLLLRYMSATEAALSRANFMATTRLVVLQALVLHIISVRDIYEPRALWTLTGVAVRIAQVMGLEWDGTSLGLPFFETEMRRRIWWQLKLNDFRTAELCGLQKFRDLDVGGNSTRWPTDLNDDQLHPGMPALEPEPESKALTDAVFVSLRCEMANFAAARVTKFRREGKSLDRWNLDATEVNFSEIDIAFGELEELLETKYLRYCDPSQPLHLMTSLMARYGLNVVRFLTHHPRRWTSPGETPLSERRLVWDICIRLLEQFDIFQANPFLKHFAWHAPYFQQWHAFIHVLDTLRADPTKIDADKAWQLIGNKYRNTPDMILDMKKPIHVAVGNLCLKAYSDREAALQNTYLPPTPDFILQLRHLQEVRRTKRQVQNSQRDVSLRHAPARQPVVASTHITQVDGYGQPISLTVSQPLDSIQNQEITIDTDPFGFFDGFGDTQIDSNLDMDLDFMMGPDYSLENNATWEQWDAWLADSNVMRPL